MARGFEINVIFLAIGFFTSCVNSLQPFVFKFGDDIGNIVHTTEGMILPFVFETKKHIEIPAGMDVTYVEVKVHSLSSPLVEYDKRTSEVTIRFSLTQLTLSRYSVLVKAVANYYDGAVSSEVISWPG